MTKKEYLKNWRIKNKDKIKSYKKEYRSLNSEHIKTYMKKYRSENRDKMKKSRKWIIIISERDGMFCRQCKTTKSLTINHVIPQCVGGNYELDNLEILCLSCNVKEYHSLVRKALMSYFKNK